jgi:2-polyprenyl-3-methyl-5-hydroxy-6-metoxy-1,4-benzoquinol methylase
MLNTNSNAKTYYEKARPELVVQVEMNARQVLEIGCGNGITSAAIKRDRNAIEVWGVEVVPEAAAKARENPSLGQVFTGDIADVLTELPDSGFSHIIAGDVLEHLVDPWSVLSDLRTRLEPGGKIISSIPNIRTLSFIFKMLFSGRFEYKDSGVLDRTHLRFFARKDIELMFEGAGFTDIEITALSTRKNVLKRIGRMIFGDLVLKRFLITARRPQKLEAENTGA